MFSKFHGFSHLSKCALKVAPSTVLVAQFILGQLLLPMPSAFAQRLDSAAQVQAGTAEDQKWSQTTGVDGVEFQLIPLDSSVNCSSVILQGTRRYQGTAFIMPRVLIGMDMNGNDLFEVTKMPRSKGKYLLTFAVFFPQAKSEVDFRKGRTPLYLHDCNTDAAIFKANQAIVDPTQKIRSLSRLPINAISVTIDGLKGRYLIGDSNTSMLNYQGLDHPVEFVINEEEREALFQRLERKQGINIKVHMRFTARVSDGALFADVDLSNVAAALKAEASGTAEIVTSAELNGRLSSAISKANINISTIAGKGQAQEKIVSDLMTMITNNVMSETESDDRSSSSYGNNSSDSSYGSSAYGAPEEGSVRLPKLFKIGGVVEYLSKKKKVSISYTNSGENSSHVYTTSRTFHGKVLDPDIREMTVASDQPAVQVPEPVRKGDTISIAVSERTVENITYPLNGTYLTIDELQRFKLTDIFDDLGNNALSVSHVDSLRGPHAVGRRASYTALGGLFKRLDGWAWQEEYYVWQRQQAFPKYDRAKRDHLQQNTPDFLRSIPVSLNFTKVGPNRYPVGSLLQHDYLKDNKYWSVEFDEIGGKLLFTAKRDLGHLKLVSEEVTPKQDFTTYATIQEKRHANKIMSKEVRSTKVERLPIQRRSFIVQIGRPSDDENFGEAMTQTIRVEPKAEVKPTVLTGAEQPTEVKSAP